MSDRKPYALATPCAQCPFRSDIAPYLRPARVREIERSLVQGEFYCHKTTRHAENEDGGTTFRPGPENIVCAGALILLEKLKRPSQMMRIAERLGLYDRRKLNMNAPVFDSFDDMTSAMRWRRSIRNR